MKKKGRVSGTIGLILAVVILGGTLVYSTMFDKKTIGASTLNGNKIPLGASAGSSFQTFTDKKGAMDSLSSLLSNADSLVDNKTAGENATYTSFSATYSYSILESSGNKNESGKWTGTVGLAEISGVIYSDANYTYETYTQSSVSSGSDGYTYITMEMVYDKTNGTTWLNEYTDSMTSASKWTQAETSMSFKDCSLISKGFQTLITVVGVEGFVDKLKVDYLTGYLSFKEKNSTEISTTIDSITFMTGLHPEINYSTSESKNKNEILEKSYKTSIVFSNLNTTKVNIPSALKNVMEGK